MWKYVIQINASDLKFEYAFTSRTIIAAAACIQGYLENT